MGSRQRKSPTFLVCAVLILHAVHLAAGQERQLNEANCAVTLPADWEDLTPTKEKPGDVLAVFGTHDQQRSLMVLLDHRGTSSFPADQWFAAEIDARCECTSAGRKIAGRFIEIAGLRGYERRGALLVHFKHVSTLVWAIPTGEGTYLLQGTVVDGKADQASDVQQTMASFRFLHPPPAVNKSRTATQSLRLYFAYFGLPALLLCVLLAVVLGVVGFCLRLNRHFRVSDYAPDQSPEGEPPPLPPASAGRPSGPYDY